MALQTATSSGVRPEVPSKRLDERSYLHSLMPALGRANERQFDDGAALQAISRSGGPLSESERSRVLETVEALRRDDAELFRPATIAADGRSQLDVQVGNWDGATMGLALLGEPQRVIKELEPVPMAPACIQPLKKLLGPLRQGDARRPWRRARARSLRQTAGRACGPVRARTRP